MTGEHRTGLFHERRTISAALAGMNCEVRDNGYVLRPDEYLVQRRFTFRYVLLRVLFVGGGLQVAFKLGNRYLRNTNYIGLRLPVGIFLGLQGARIFNYAANSGYGRELLSIPDSPLAKELRSQIVDAEGPDGPWMTRHAPTFNSAWVVETRETVDDDDYDSAGSHTKPEKRDTGQYGGYELLRERRKDSIPAFGKPGLAGIQPDGVQSMLYRTYQTVVEVEDEDDPRNRLADYYAELDTDEGDPEEEMRKGWLSLSYARRKLDQQGQQDQVG
ncbi:hypothetical protein NDN08_002280 [Rhodosorus marinus]|uniref:Transmembrane protein 186 n=1 Tax=Rhodosorus marinus TaxID=101924 RepID=A0AAV8UT97_9RHOD|nr:hypothetical protein NDN08_002280 [Rhodosorus marinus]